MSRTLYHRIGDAHVWLPDSANAQDCDDIIEALRVFQQRATRLAAVAQRTSAGEVSPEVAPLDSGPAAPAIAESGSASSERTPEK